MAPSTGIPCSSFDDKEPFTRTSYHFTINSRVAKPKRKFDPQQGSIAEADVKHQ
jgi:hypothetical protein